MSSGEGVARVAGLLRDRRVGRPRERTILRRLHARCAAVTQKECSAAWTCNTASSRRHGDDAVTAGCEGGRLRHLQHTDGVCDRQKVRSRRVDFPALAKIVVGMRGRLGLVELSVSPRSPTAGQSELARHTASSRTKAERVGLRCCTRPTASALLLPCAAPQHLRHRLEHVLERRAPFAVDVDLGRHARLQLEVAGGRE